MPCCPEFEDRLLDYAELEPADRVEVDLHLAGCYGCSCFQQALLTVDSLLSSALTIEASSLRAGLLLEIADRLPVQRPPQRPSLWPAIFDLIGWASIAVIAIVVTEAIVPGAVWQLIALMGIAATSWVSLEGWRELRD